MVFNIVLYNCCRRIQRDFIKYLFSNINIKVYKTTINKNKTYLNE